MVYSFRIGLIHPRNNVFAKWTFFVKKKVLKTVDSSYAIKRSVLIFLNINLATMYI